MFKICFLFNIPKILCIKISIVNFLFGVHTSQLIRYSRDGACNHDFLNIRVASD